MQTAEGPAHGTQRAKQWHEDQPERLNEERSLVESAYPDFSFSFDKEGNAQWEGQLKLDPALGACSYSIVPVRITCLSSYPNTVPLILDLERKLSDYPHAETTGRICLENLCTSDPNRLYTANRRIKDTVADLQELLRFYWRWKQDGEDVQGQLHGEFAFIEFELESGCATLDGPCLCGRHGVTYEECCHPKVLRRIEEMIPTKKQRGYEKCRCGSGRTYRKCGARRRCPYGTRYCDPKNPMRDELIKRMRFVRQQQEAADKKRLSHA